MRYIYLDKVLFPLRHHKRESDQDKMPKNRSCCRLAGLISVLEVPSRAGWPFWVRRTLSIFSQTFPGVALSAGSACVMLFRTCPFSFRLLPFTRLLSREDFLLWSMLLLVLFIFFYLLLQVLLSHCVTGNLFSGDLPWNLPWSSASPLFPGALFIFCCHMPGRGHS